ncbi:chlorophyll a/b-binding protein [Leptolyngbyaceae cyanobacterium UHCC 1019]
MNESVKSEVEKNKADKKPEPFNQPEPAFGWTAYAEQINGRFAMLGFVVLLLIEVFTQQNLLTWLGLR